MTQETGEVVEVRLHRTGDKPLVFMGEQIACVESAEDAVKKRKRWFTLAAYRTRGGKIVVYRHYSTQWPGERDFSAAKVCADMDEAAIWFRDWTPRLLDGIGYPVTMREQQERLIADLTADYGEMVAELLNGTETVERVE